MRGGVAVNMGGTGETVGVADWERNADGDGLIEGGVAGSGVPQAARSNANVANQKVSLFIA
jgi:hypothetical protein